MLLLNIPFDIFCVCIVGIVHFKHSDKTIYLIWLLLLCLNVTAYSEINDIQLENG